LWDRNIRCYESDGVMYSYKNSRKIRIHQVDQEMEIVGVKLPQALFILFNFLVILNLFGIILGFLSTILLSIFSKITYRMEQQGDIWFLKHWIRKNLSFLLKRIEPFKSLEFPREVYRV